MKKLIFTTFSILFLSACGGQGYHYQTQTNPQAWQGKNIADVEKQWGVADQIFETAEGNTYYVYTTTSGRNLFSSTSTNFALTESSNDFPMRTQLSLKCSAIFKTNNKGIIIATSHSGSNCGGQWAPGA